MHAFFRDCVVIFERLCEKVARKQNDRLHGMNNPPHVVDLETVVTGLW